MTGIFVALVVIKIEVLVLFEVRCFVCEGEKDGEVRVKGSGGRGEDKKGSDRREKR